MIKIIAIYIFIGLVWAIGSLFYGIKNDIGFKKIRKEYGEVVEVICKIISFITWIFLYPYYIYKFSDWNKK